MSAEVKILIEGFTMTDSVARTGEEKTRATVTLIKDGDLAIVVDPGVLDDQQILVDALRKEGLAVSDVSIVCITHSHLDHYRNIGMFPKAKTLEYFGLWDGEAAREWQEKFSRNVRVLKTPGHDPTSISVFVTTKTGVVAICGDVFWKENHPAIDPYATDLKELEKSRGLVLKNADWIIPGHGPMYQVNKKQGR
jgi:glyoxylase-like metal-dependent hydrolase (beta-lactamase superfamily II)